MASQEGIVKTACSSDSEPSVDSQEDFWSPSVKKRKTYCVEEDGEEANDSQSHNGNHISLQNRDEQIGGGGQNSDHDSDATIFVEEIKDDLDSSKIDELCQTSVGEGGNCSDDSSTTFFGSSITTTALGFPDKDEEDELLSIPSADEGGNVSDEELHNRGTFSDQGPPSMEKLKPRQEDNQPNTSSSAYRSHRQKAYLLTSEAAVDSSSDEDIDLVLDPEFKPGGSGSSETDFDFSDAEDFKLPKKKKNASRTPLAVLNTPLDVEAQTSSYRSSSDEENDASPPLPVACRDRPAPKKPKRSPRGMWVGDGSPVEDIESYFQNYMNPRPAYNPTEVRNESWHGDVQRTITMLDKTISSMPMPGDDGIEDVKLPPGLVELYPHQLYAFKWLSWREEQFPGGGILADEMGLGKTIEMISLIMKSKWEASKSGNENVVTSKEAGRKVPSSTTLVVSPLGCIPQWCREIETKGRNLKIYTYHGSKKLTSAVDISKYDVVITTYQTIAHEIPKPHNDPERPQPRCRSPLKRIYWLRIILDEAHQIRNPKTNAAQAIYQLEARHRWAVTGTPIHNRPEDFYSMCAFLRLEPFDDRKTWDFWIGLKTIKRSAEQRLHVLGKALILRRTKDEVGLAGSNDGKVSKIPPKSVQVITIQLKEDEREVYDQLMAYARSILKEFLSQKEQREHGLHIGGLLYASDRVQQLRENFPEEVRFSHIFALLIRLRQCAVLPFLVETMIEGEGIDEEEQFTELRPEDVISKKNPIFKRTYLSSKFEKILEDIDELRDIAHMDGKPMDKVIIVSSWTTTLDIIHEHLMRKQYTCVFITGRDDMNVRMDNMDRFNKNEWRPQILLLSLMAGGVGLNLIGANHVFFLEPHWNPQHELQAQDRVHRFGQKKDVFIRRYIAEDTIESRIMDLQLKKLELADGLLNNTKKTKGAGISLQEMKKLFDL